MRSKWKGFFIKDFLLAQKKDFLKFKCRNSVITSNLIGKTILVHNGKEFKKIYISREKIGFKFGEFALTRKYNYKKGSKK